MKKPKGHNKFDSLMRKLVKVKPLGNGVDVKIVGKHPHAGCTGTISGNLHTSKIFPDWRMCARDFERCAFG